MTYPIRPVLMDDEVGAAVLDIIRNAEEFVFLVSPYIDFWGNLKTAIEEARKKDIPIVFIHRPIEKDSRKAAKAHKDLAWLRARDVEVYAAPSLHAKIYFNESKTLLTSMNLYDYSSNNSLEAGILVAPEEVPSLQWYVRKRLMSKVADTPQTAKSRQAQGRGMAQARKQVKGLPTNGRCIRCGESIPYDPIKPLCLKCFRSWNRYKEQDYPERHCHACGREAETSFAEPLCADCRAAA